MATAAPHDSEQYWLRPLGLQDIPTVSGWYQQVDDLAMFHQRMPVPLSADAIEAAWREYIVAAEPRTSYWFMVDDDQRTPAGFGGIEGINYAHSNALAPFFIAEHARRRGVALRLRALLLDLAFDQLGLARISSIHRADNVGSRHVNDACGFHEEGRLRRGWRADGEWIDVIVMGLLADEWRERRAAMRRKLGDHTIVTLGDDPAGRWSWPSVSPAE